MSEELKDGVQDIELDFGLKNKKITFGKNDFDSQVLFKLNKSPIWNIDLYIGAGEVDYDLSKFKVKRVEIKTGATDVNLKMGDLYPSSTLKIESGVAKINLDVPESSACEIEMDGALNAKNFDGFTKTGNGRWETSNFKTAKNKITIKLESGLSVVDIDRY
jgi:hypothetical protein